MQLSIEQRLARLTGRVLELRFWAESASVDVPSWTFNGEQLSLGSAWPTRAGVVAIASSGLSVPADWPLEQVRLHLDLGGEGLVHLHYVDGGVEGFGLDPYHQYFPLTGRQLDVEASVVARLPFGIPNRQAALNHARLVLLEPELVNLLRRLDLVTLTATTLNMHEVAPALIDCAETALRALDWPSATEPYLARTYDSAAMLEIWQRPEIRRESPALSPSQREAISSSDRQLERDLLALRERYPHQGDLAITGQAHLDLAWLWPLDETRRKAQRTYHSMIALLDRYPEFRFHQSTAQVYAFLEVDDPELFARIQERVAAGQWEPIGGMWVEPDANMPCGESLARQLLYGQRYFRSRFGSYHTVCWMPDCFGFTPALPQILRLAGIEHFFTVKLTWSETNRFPYDLFYWEGLDGSRVLAHMFENPGGGVEPWLSGYNGDVSPNAIVNTWKNYRGKYLSPQSLLSIGYGDGGGGVTSEMLEHMRVLEGFPAVPSLQFTHVSEFFERMRSAVQPTEHKVPVWVGELYLELHRGTLTTHGGVKHLHRRAERDLVAAEVTGSLAHLAGGPAPGSLETDWQVVLRNEFHDILPGSGIREVCETAEAELAGVVGRAGRSVDKSMETLTKHIVPAGEDEALLVLNPDLSERPLRLKLDSNFPGTQSTEDGYVLTGATRVPGLAATVILRGDAPGKISVSTQCLENDHLRVELDGAGCVTRVYDKHAERDVLDGRGNQLWVYVDKPRNWDAWDIEAGYEEVGEELTAAASVQVLESGPHRVAVRVQRYFRNSRIQQDIRLWANSARLEFATELDWHDRHYLLRARFPVQVRSNSVTYETAFGVVQRPTHRNTSWEQARFEVAGHRFADLSEPGYGVALLNDGKYGHDASSSVLGLSLHRSPAFPDPLAGEGKERFTYALLPHMGSWVEGGVLMEAEDLNRPLLARRCCAGSTAEWRAVEIGGVPQALGTLKPLEDGSGLVLRSYEPQGGRGTARVTLPDGWELDAELNILEEEVGGPDLGFTPFQVHSWRVVRSTK